MDPRGAKPGRPKAGGMAGGLDPVAGRAIPAIGEVRLLRALDELETILRDVGEADKAVRLLARFAAQLLYADHRCVALLKPGQRPADIVHTGAGEPGPGTWPADLLADFARGLKPDLPASVAVARLKRRRRPGGTIAPRWERVEPDWAARTVLTRLAGVTNDALERIEARRLAEVRARIDRKIMEQLRPKDLFYQILDGLRSLTGYDHSGTVLLRVAGTASLELVAEQLAYRKGKGGRSGHVMNVAPDRLASLRGGEVWGFSRAGLLWDPWDARTPRGLAEWVRETLGPAAGAPAEAEAIIAPLRSGEDVTGVLKVSATQEGTFGLYEAELVAALLPHAAIALQNARRAESLEDNLILAERKSAMAELARGVSHDVNNALGAVLPLVQQLREEVREGRVQPDQLSRDLDEIERSVRTCTRIFGGMLQFGRRAAKEGVVSARLDTALDSALSILGEGLRRGEIEVKRSLPGDLPPLPLRQSELEQIMLNLIGNARDGMAAAGRGGELNVEAALEEQSAGPPLIRLSVADTGVGIPQENLKLVLEPFFTTKPGGNGLGLAICRSIVWQC